MQTLTRVTILLPPPQGIRQHDFVAESIKSLLHYGGGGRGVANIVHPSTVQLFDLNGVGELQWENGVLLLVDVPTPYWSPNLQLFLGELKLRFQKEFGEDVIWMTVQEVIRVTAHDDVK